MATFWLTSCIVISFLVFLLAGYAYLVNLFRQPNDPAYQDFEPAAIPLSLITWPFFLCYAIGITIFKVIQTIARAVLFGLLLLASLVAVLFSPVFLVSYRILKFALKIGTEILKANTFVIRIFLKSTARLQNNN